jgi:hypothetical protein
MKISPGDTSSVNVTFAYRLFSGSAVSCRAFDEVGVRYEAAAARACLGDVDQVGHIGLAQAAPTSPPHPGHSGRIDRNVSSEMRLCGCA